MPIDVTGYRLLAPLRAGSSAGSPAGGDAADASDAAAAGAGGPLPSSGGAAQVWSGRRISDGAAVALKLFHPADGARAAREAALAAAVDHPHVLPVLEVATGAQVVALVMPLAEGGSLASLIGARRRLRWPEVLTVLIPLADALAAAHERDIVHGDLSAGNVLFDGEGRPLLADLGAARAATECGVTVAVTPTDVAPEIARGADPSPAADLFSLGSVALHVLCGRPAWPADDLQDVLIQSAAGQWPDPDDLLGPPELLAIVRRLLDPEPDRRGSAAQAAVELRRAGLPEPVELATRQPDGTVTAPPPATVVRQDALRPPSTSAPRGSRRTRTPRRSRRGRPARGIAHARLRAAAGVPRPGSGRLTSPGGAPAGRHHRQRMLTRVGSLLPRTARHRTDRPDRAGRARPVRRRWWPAAVAVAVLLLLGAGAVRVGLWWAGWGDTDPTAVAAVARAQRSAAGGSPDTASPPGASSPSAAAPDGSDADWLSVVAALDDARAAALTSGDPGLLADVYTPDAPARRTDERRISALARAGYHVTAATHTMRSATLLRIGDDGSVTVRVVESMPSYPIVDAGGTVVGTTAASGRSIVLLHLRNTDGGFRIDRISRP